VYQAVDSAQEGGFATPSLATTIDMLSPWLHASCDGACWTRQAGLQPLDTYGIAPGHLYSLYYVDHNPLVARRGQKSFEALWRFSWPRLS